MKFYGIYDYFTDGFVYSKDVASLVRNFPNAVKLLGSLDRTRNYGFVQADGSVERTGMMGAADPIMEAKQMMTAYSAKPHKGPQLFATEEAYESYCEDKRMREFADRMQQGLPPYW